MALTGTDDLIHKRGVVGASPTFGTSKDARLGARQGETGQRVSHTLWLDREIADRLLAVALKGIASRIAQQAG